MFSKINTRVFRVPSMSTWSAKLSKLTNYSLQSMAKPVIVLPKEYANINSKRPRSYWDYEKFEIQWNLPYNYEVKKKIGRGKYSDVFEGINIKNNTKCCIKMLKPVKKKKIQREILILQNLSGSSNKNIIQLLDYVRDPISKTPSLIFEYFEGCHDWKYLNKILTENEWKWYFYQLLLSINHCHSNGIIHRDIKPHNVIIKHSENIHERIIRLIDFGLAEFYHGNKDYNVRVASRYYKSPELLTKNRFYHYSMDIWSFGCILAGVIFKNEPLFKGNDNNDQLCKITKILGTDELFKYLKKYNLKLDPEIDVSLGRTARKPWNKFLVSDDKRGDINNKKGDNALVIDLIDRCLQYDMENRITATEALKHDYFKDVEK